MRWSILLVVPLGIYLLATGTELLTVALVLATSSVIVEIVADNFRSRRGRERA